MIPISEFSENELEKLNVGDTISCFVERLEGRSGEIVLSYQKSKSYAAWEKCKGLRKRRGTCGNN